MRSSACSRRSRQECWVMVAEQPVERSASRLLHLAPLAGRGRFASGALAKRSKSGEGAVPQAQTRGSAPSPGFLRCARNPTSPRTRGEVEYAARLAYQFVPLDLAAF